MEAERRRTRPDRRRRRATPALLVGLGAAYIGLSLAVWQLADPTETSAPWWPAAGLTLGVLCRVRRSSWPAVLAVIFAADVTADLIQGAAVLTSLGWATANTVEPLLGALALRWAFRGRMPNIESSGSVVRFFAVAALAGTPFASFIGALASSTAYDIDFLETWRVWYSGDVLGILVVAPAVLYAPQIRNAFDGRVAAFILVNGLVAGVVFRLNGLQLYLVGPLLVLTAIAFGAPAALPATLAVATIAYIASSLGYGPFALGDGDPAALTGLQLFTLVQAITIYLVIGLRAQLLSARAHAEELGEQQLRDGLTGTGSRLLVEDALAEAASEPAVGDAQTSAAVLYLDLDAFKPVNDEHGHTAGDRVLCEVARRLEEAVRDTDTVGRVGGDEFVVVCRDITPSELERLAARIRERIEAPIRLNNERVRVGASVGTSWTAGPSANPADLLRRADLDMYERKLAREAPADTAVRPRA